MNEAISVVCMACPEDHYMGNISDSVCTVCPENRATFGFEGAKTVNDCAGISSHFYNCLFVTASTIMYFYVSTVKYFMHEGHLIVV